MKKSDRQRRETGQLPLAFEHAAARGRDDLRVSDPLSAAVSIIDEWPRWPSPVVILAGPEGAGKSHLAAIWRERSGAVPISAEMGATASELAALGPVVFEDADRAGFDDDMLFHVINSVRENGTSLLMTSRLWPMSWPVTLPDLVSRLKATTVVEIGEPDEDLLSQVIVKLFADRQLLIDDKLVLYIVNRMERSMRAAQKIVESLDHLALARGTRITRTLAGEVIDEMSGGQGGE